MEVSLAEEGGWANLERHLKKLAAWTPTAQLRALAEKGVQALRSATPVDSGVTAASWDYSIRKESGVYTIEWTNSNTRDGIPVAILLQYGHATGTGGYVRGRDFINPAMRPLFNQIERDFWKVVSNGG